MPLSMENGWDEWSTSLCQFLLPTLTSCSWFPSMATRIGPIEGREQSGHIQFFIIFLGYKSWLADVCSKISPKNSPCFFSANHGKPSNFPWHVMASFKEISGNPVLDDTFTRQPRQSCICSWATQHREFELRFVLLMVATCYMYFSCEI